MPEFFNSFNWETFKKPNQSFRNVNYDPNAELNWDAHDWLNQRTENDRGPKYTEQDVKIFNSHVPEYKQIEQNSKSNGTWLQMPDGSRWVGDPREWVIMQSEAFKKNYQENPWYTGQAEWETQVTLPDGTVINTDKVKRARYHNGEMWFSNDAGYAQYFADTVGREGLGVRGQFINNPNYKTDHNIKGTVFLAGIPKTGNYRKLEGPKTGYDHWRHMPFILTETGFKRTNEKTNLLTDDLVSHSRKLGDDGLFLFNVNDGPVLRNKYKENKMLPYFARPGHMNNDPNSRLETVPINEFISQPGFTEKIKFIRGNNGNFDPNTDDKYSAIFKIDSPLFAKKGGRIHIKKKNRGSFTRWCNGKVTEECIRRGKNSSNPAIRKKATFAANSRRWKHENGGILKAQNSAKLPGYVQYNGSDLSDIETFNKNWLNYRNSQLANQGWKDESIKNKLNWFQRNFGASDKTVANLVREQLFSNLDNTKELSFSDALKDLQGRYLLTESMYADFPGERELHEVEIGPPKPVEDWKLDYSFNGSVGGTHYPDFNTIIYNNLYQNTPTKIHERDHAMFGQYNDKNIGLKIVDNIFKQEFLDNVVDKWGYYDEPSEIRARLMQMRYNNRLDPNHKYTFDEIENMRNDSTFIDEHIFDRYTNRYIEYLLNDVAQNTTNKNRLDYKSPINFAKDGGILKAQEGTGNLYAPHPLSPVGIALNQAKAMAKGKKDQQHLPPEVKEVVGPDGKKVAIRTEQPLVPLEQSIAEWLPGTGDVAEIGYIANDVKNGNYGTAALAAGLMFIPGNARKILDKFGIDLGDISTFRKLSDQEWDDMYFQAIDSGDMGLVQTIRDAHFKVKATGASVDADGNLIKTYRGQYSKQKYKEHDLNPFSDKRDVHGSSGYFSSTSSQIADTYVQPGGDKFELYTNFTNPSVVDAKGKGYKTAVSQVEPDGRVVGIQTDDYVNKAFKQGYDGVIIKNVKDASVGNTLTDLEKIADDYVGAAGRSKLADPITREFDIFTADYEIIPISRRDNFNIPDIRYGIAPLILGLGAAKTVSNSNTKEQQ